nr:MAG TPA: hypothetical protein [Caudoviricetes sp.]
MFKNLQTIQLRVMQRPATLSLCNIVTSTFRTLLQ